jgi:hypothetical protein
MVGRLWRAALYRERTSLASLAIDARGHGVAHS